MGETGAMKYGVEGIMQFLGDLVVYMGVMAQRAPEFLGALISYL